MGSAIARQPTCTRAAATSVLANDKTTDTEQEKDAADLDWKFDLVRSVGEECQTEKELRNLLEKKPDFVLYDGFEPSGRMHIAQGVFKTINVNKCTKAGGTFIFWVADWFALMNDKMGGDLEKIKTVGKYLIEVWKASGMDMSRVRFLWSSEEISSKADAYWGQALDVACRTTLARVKKCCQIMGRQEDTLTAAQILYPIMQCADVFFLRADVCQLGVDQRKVNMLARDYCDAAGRKLKPVILSHHMLLGLKKGQAKMSKSDPDSAIFMEDAPEDVARKVRNAYCPKLAEEMPETEEESMSLVEDDLKNPCLDYIQYVLFSQEGFAMKIGDTTYSSFESLRRAFVAGEVGEDELKEQLIDEVNLLLEPVRQHFQTDPEAKELLRKVTEWKRESLQAAKPTAPSLVAHGVRAGPVFAVFAPLPSEHVRLGDVWGVLRRMREAPDGHQRVLWLEDWSARALGCAGGTTECIEGFYRLLLFGLNSLAPELMEGVQVCWQGETILAAPSEYWTSVINTGRQCSLDDVRSGLAPGEQLDGAGQVVASLMHASDVMALAGCGDSLVLCSGQEREGAHALAARQLEQRGLPAPSVQVTEAPSLRLRAEGEGLEADTNLFLTDREMDVNRKVKKAFCEPENTDFCPPLEWVDALLPLSGEFVLKRKEANGGDKSYTTVDAIREDFAAGELHPGDLKPAVGGALNRALAAARDGLKGSKELKNAQKKLEAYAKKKRKAAK